MKNIKDIILLGERITLRPFSSALLKGLWAELLVSYSLYDFSYQGQDMILLAKKGNIDVSPGTMAKISSRLESIRKKPCVFYFNSIKTYERDRLVASNVYFIVNSQYCFLPSLLINRKSVSSPTPVKFSPSTQRLILHHLQKDSLEGKSISEIAEAIGYGYPTVAKSINHLQQLGLAEGKTSFEGIKTVHFDKDGKELWLEIQPYLINPVKKRLYARNQMAEGMIGGINALSNYSMLAPDPVATRVLTEEEFKNGIESLSEEMGLNRYDGPQQIEIWKYNPIQTSTEYVDPLSLALSLQDDNDPRVEKEIENMINDMQW